MQRLARILVLAACYFAVGRLALLLAIPPGYATAVWPPAGIALAALLLYGEGLWPGALLGQLAVNFSAQAGGISPDDGAALARTLLVALGIAGGGTLQAFVAARLIRRFVGVGAAFADETRVLRLFALAGPLGCLISPTVGSLTLLATGEIRGAQLPLTWSTWWVGDAIGAMIFAPTLLVWGIRRAAGWRRIAKVVLPMAGLFLLALTMFLITSRIEQRRVREQFEAVSGRMVRSVMRELALDVNALNDLQSLYRSFRAVEPGQFRVFALDQQQNHPGVIALAWLPVVPEHRRAAFEASVRARGPPEFRIFEMDGNGRYIPAAPRPTHVVVEYIEPLAANRVALGFDIASDPARLAAAEAARDSGEPVLTGRIRALQLSAGAPALVMIAPIYDGAEVPRDTAARRIALRGYVNALIRVDAVVERALEGIGHEGIGIRLLDEDAEGGALELYANPSVSANGPDDGGPRSAQKVGVAGRHWTVITWAVTPHYGRSWTPWAALAGGLLFTALMGAFLLTLLGRQEQIEAQVVARTAELRESEARLHHLFDHSGDIIYRCTPEGDFAFVSPAVESVLGYTPKELSGRPVSEVLSPGAGADGARPLRAQIERRLPAAYWESEAVARDGRRVWLGQNSRLLEHDGRVEGLIVVARDIDRQRRRMETLRRSNSLLAEQALSDPLTAVANRRRFDEAFAVEWSRARRSGEPLSLVLVDIDHFKRYNDTYGHPAGDACLRTVAGALHDEARRAGELVARYGGEEFALLLPGTRLEDAVAIANRARERVRALALAHAGAPSGIVTVSMGVAAGPDHHPDAAALLAAADGALYAAKAGGRDAVKATPA